MKLLRRIALIMGIIIINNSISVAGSTSFVILKSFTEKQNKKIHYIINNNDKLRYVIKDIKVKHTVEYVINDYTITNAKVILPNEILNDNIKVSMYPMPSSGNLLNIESDKNIDNISIYNISGDLILEKKIDNLKLISINISELNSDTYYCKISCNDNVKIEKFSVVR